MHFTENIERTSQYYDAIYSRGYDTRNYYPLYVEVIRMIEKPGGPQKVLEIGCGVGDLGKMLIEKGHTYRGFDFSPAGIDSCKKLCPSGDFSVGNAYEPSSFQPVNYDTVVALEVLEHLDDLRVLSNLPIGVRFIASVPDYDDIAHLRLYQSPRKDIVERFNGLLRISEILPMVFTRVNSEKDTIFLFHGKRIDSGKIISLSDN
jgi:SAM-dependent methyltransferase